MKFCFNEIDPDVLTILAAILATGVSQNRNADELNVIGNFIVAVGGLILTEAAQISNQKAKKDTAAKIKAIHQQMEQLQQSLAEIECSNR